MKPVYLICGVSGTGKTWVCKQLLQKFTYIAHDEHYKDHAQVIASTAKHCDKPIITECPFAERVLREDLERMGCTVIPYFVIEDPHTVAARYLARENKPLPKNAFTRATTITKRADEWQAPRGTSKHVLELLKELSL